MAVNWDDRIDDKVYEEAGLFTAADAQTGVVSEKSPGHLVRNIVLAVLIQSLIVTIITLSIVWWKKQKE